MSQRLPEGSDCLLSPSAGLERQVHRPESVPVEGIFWLRERRSVCDDRLWCGAGSSAVRQHWRVPA